MPEIAAVDGSFVLSLQPNSIFAGDLLVVEWGVEWYCSGRVLISLWGSLLSMVAV